MERKIELIPEGSGQWRWTVLEYDGYSWKQAEGNVEITYASASSKAWIAYMELNEK